MVAKSMLFAFALGIALFISVIIGGCTKNKTQTETISFEKSIISDAESKYPGADIIEIEGTESVGEYNITNVRVTFNYTSVCPVRMRLRYKHPLFGYETGVPTYIIKDCVYRCEGTCIITSEEEAIVAAHTLPNTKNAQEFINNNGMENVNAKAVYYENEGIWSITFASNSNATNKINVNITSKNPKVVGIAFNS